MDIDALVSEAVDTTRLQAQNSQIEIVVGGQPGLQTRGVEGQLVTA